MQKLFLFLLIICFGCKKENPKSLLDAELVYFNNELMFDLNSSKFNKTDSKVKAVYVDDLIIVSKMELTNACPDYTGNIELKKDSIYLNVKIASEDICDSNEIRKFTFVIKNSKKQKFKFGFREE